MRYQKSWTIRLLVSLPILFSLLVAQLADKMPVRAQTSGPQLTVTPIDQPAANPEIAIRSDTQEVSPDQNLITGNGNAFFVAPSQQIEATAAQVQYFRREQRVVLIGNVSLKQQNKTIKAEKITCLLATGECDAAETVQLVPNPPQKR